MDRAYANIASLYKISSLENPFHTLGELFSASMWYIRDSQKSLPEGGEAYAQSQNGYANVDRARLDPTVSVATVSWDLHPAESGSLMS